MQKFCSNCGAELQVGSGFCSKCGAMVSMSMDNNQFVSSGKNVQVQHVQPAEQRAKSSYGAISMILTGVTLVCVMGAGVFVDTYVAAIFVFPGIITWLVGFVLGIIGAKRDAHKGLAITGIVLNAIPFLVIIGVMMFGAGYESGRDYVPRYYY